MRADRLLSIILLLQTRGKMTAKTLAEELEVSRRTILRDINTRLAPLGQRPGVTFLDITDKWLGPLGLISKDIMPDSLHPNQKGYAVWAEALKAVLPE